MSPSLLQLMADHHFYVIPMCPIGNPSLCRPRWQEIIDNNLTIFLKKLSMWILSLNENILCCRFDNDKSALMACLEVKFHCNIVKKKIMLRTTVLR